MKADNAREIVKILLMKENISVSKLAEMLSTPQKKMYQQTLSAKLINGTCQKPLPEHVFMIRILRF